jgi:hypothetical protein
MTLRDAGRSSRAISTRRRRAIKLMVLWAPARRLPQSVRRSSRRLLSDLGALRYVKGIGPRRAEALSGVGIERLDDLVEVFPFRWEDRRAFARVADLTPNGPEVTLDLRVVGSR